MSNRPTRLYLLGAGASVPCGLPTLKTVLKELRGFLDEGERAALCTAAFEVLGCDIATDNTDFEEFLNRLHPSVLRYLPTSVPTSDTWRRARVIALSGLRRYLIEKSRAPAGPYRTLVDSLRPTDAIVSFNWDVIVERTFRDAGRDYDYLLEKPDHTLLLKPHGSVSWFALLDRELLVIDVNANLAPLGNDLRYLILFQTDPLAPIEMGNSSYFAKRAVAGVPAILLPAAPVTLSVGGATSDGFVDNAHTAAMEAVWSAFASLVRQVKEIVVIGYSLPGTDGAAIEVLKQFGRRKDDDRRLLVVDPSEAVANRYRELIFSDAEHVAAGFEGFDPTAI